MNKKIKAVFPYIATIALWHLSGPVFNPFGVLAVIPIFYYTFCERAKRWFPFGVFMCFLIDYNAGTLFLFSAFFLFTNAINNIYGVLDNEDGSLFNIKKFNMFLFALAVFLFLYAVFGAAHFWSFLFGIIWLYALLVVLYLPLAATFKRVSNDR